MKNTKLVVSEKGFEGYSGAMLVLIAEEDKGVSSYVDKQIKKVLVFKGIYSCKR